MGVYDFNGEELLFHFDYVRQFTVYEEEGKPLTSKATPTVAFQVGVLHAEMHTIRPPEERVLTGIQNEFPNWSNFIERQFYSFAEDVRDVLDELIYKQAITKKEQVYQWVKRYVEPSSSVGGRLINEMRETRFKEGFECPHCLSVHVVRFGKYNGRQRYRCNCCNKTFTDTTNTVLYRSRNGNEWITFVDCMFKGYSLRKSAEIVGVTWVTLFYWRHKLLSALKQIDIKHFDGIVEIDETYFLYSQKGQRGITNRKPRKRGGKSKHRGISYEQVCVLVARDRTKQLSLKLLVRGVL